MSKEIIILSKLTANYNFGEKHYEGSGKSCHLVKGKTVKIYGGADVPERGKITPDGIIQTLTEEEWEICNNDRLFVECLKGDRPSITVIPDISESVVEEALKNIVKKDGGASLSTDSFKNTGLEIGAGEETPKIVSKSESKPIRIKKISRKSKTID